MAHRITVLPQNVHTEASTGDRLLNVLRAAGLAPAAPCGGTGHCGKCKVLVDGRAVLACQTIVDQDMTVILSETKASAILTGGIASPHRVSPVRDGYLLAFDIGTTTVVGYLLDGRSGQEIACKSMHNPQAAFGADVISRIGHALSGQLAVLTGCIRKAIESLTVALCEAAKVCPTGIGVVSIVGNPAMQQLFLGISPDNLAKIPFSPVLTRAEAVDASRYLPFLESASLLIVPDISGFVGADTVACVLATRPQALEGLTLLVDIGTNGEMVLAGRQQMVACSTAAGPALEGANIQCGMSAQEGAIDHVWLQNGQICCSVIGEGKAVGICGSGIIDAIAVALEAGLINERGRILCPERIIRLTETVYLTQEDVRQIQLAKGAIAAGIELMAAHFGVEVKKIDRVFLAGAFGTYLDPASACRIGLLPPVLMEKIQAVGNAAGSGAKLLALDRQALIHAQQIAENTTFMELATVPGFQRCFAKNMRF